MRTAVALIALATSVEAGGLTRPTRGMHSTERAGALVVGADDADALFLDPAGLACVAGDGQRSLYVMSPRLRLGATLQDTVSMLDWSLVASACPGTMVCNDASYDLPLHLTQNDYSHRVARSACNTTRSPSSRSEPPPKWSFGLGGGYSADGWDLGVAAGLAQLSNVTVDAAAVAQLAPLRDFGTAPTYINAGTYAAYDLTVGLRGSRRF